MNKILLIGAGGHSRACIDVIEQENKFKIAGLIDKKTDYTDENLGYPIVGTDEDLKQLRNKYQFALVTVGQIKSPNIRINLYNILKSIGYMLPVVVSNNAHVSKHARIDEGTIILHGVVVNTGARIGRNCIINNQSLIEHDAIISDHCHIATGAIINGEVKVGEGSFIGSGVVINHRVKIGRNCVIGSGSVIKTNIPDNQLIKN